MARVPQSPTTDFTSTTLNGAINSVVTSIDVNDASTMVAPCYIVIDREDNNGNATPTLREVVYVSAISSNTLTVTRGVDNSTARAHNDSALVEPMITVGFWDDFYDAYDLDHTPYDGSHDITKVAMLSGTTVQTLAGKILSSPTITSPTMTSVILSTPTIIQPTFTLLQGASVAPTADGDIRWRTGDDTVLIGDGTNSLPVQMGTWRGFTPTFTGITVGSGSVTGAYTQIGKTVIFDAYFQYASNSTITGNSAINLPVPAKTAPGTAGVLKIGDVSFYDTGVAVKFGILVHGTSAGTIQAYQSSASYVVPAAISSTLPITWGTGDELLIHGMYESA